MLKCWLVAQLPGVLGKGSFASGSNMGEGHMRCEEALGSD